MKKIFILLLMLSMIPVYAQYVKGYYRDNGTYVQGYHRTNADSSKYNNYSTKGNYNPYTGQTGNVDPYKNNYGYNTGRSSSFNNSYNSKNTFGNW